VAKPEQDNQRPAVETQQVDPRNTDHPTGTKEAAENAANDPAS
jgi:hypothetical protein